MYRVSGYTTWQLNKRALIGLAGAPLLAFSTILSGSIPIQAQAAGSAKLYASPSSSSVESGKNVTLSVRMDSGSQEASAIEVYGTYDQSKLQFIGMDNSGSPYDFTVEKNGGNGQFEIVSVAFSQNTTGDVLITRLTFKALTDGRHTVALTGESKLSDPEGELFSLTRSGATVNAASVSDSGGGSGSTGSSSGGSGGSSTSGGSGSSQSGSTSNTNQTGLGITVEPDYVGYTLATFIAQTTRNARVSISYGPSSEDLEFTTKPTKAGTKHQMLLDSKLLLPGTDYFYQVTAIDSSGNTVKSDISSFKTQGVPLTLRVLDPNRNPVSGITVKLKDNDTINAVTNSEGYAVFDSLPGGDITFIVSPGFWQSSEHVVSLGSPNITTEKVEGVNRYIQLAEQNSDTIQLEYKPIVIGLDSILQAVGIVVGLGALLIITLRLINLARTRINYARTLGQQQSPSVINPTNSVSENQPSPPAVPPPTTPPPGYNNGYPSGPPSVAQPPTQQPPHPPATGSQAPGQVVQPNNPNNDDYQ